MIKQNESRIIIQKDTDLGTKEDFIKELELAAKTVFEKVNVVVFKDSFEMIQSVGNTLNREMKNLFVLYPEDNSNNFITVQSYGIDDVTFVDNEELSKFFTYVHVKFANRTQVVLINDNNANFELLIGEKNDATTINYKCFEFGSSHIYSIIVTDTKGEVKINQGVAYTSKANVLYNLINQFVDIVLSEKRKLEDGSIVDVPVERGDFFIALSRYKDDVEAPVKKIESIKDVISFVDETYSSISFKGLTKEEDIKLV